MHAAAFSIKHGKFSKAIWKTFIKYRNLHAFSKFFEKFENMENFVIIFPFENSLFYMQLCMSKPIKNHGKVLMECIEILQVARKSIGFFSTKHL